MAGRKLKVFQAQFGFFDTVVAAPSQTAALRAWGIHQNLFASGDARFAVDLAAIDLAVAHPGTVLRRAVGSAEPFALEPTSLPEAPRAKKKARSSRPAGPVDAPRQPPADRSELDAAEKAASAIDTRRKREEAELVQKEAELDAAREEAQTRFVAARAAARAKVLEARARYKKAGGAD